jgi:hypothetical protein
MAKDCRQRSVMLPALTLPAKLPFPGLFPHGIWARLACRLGLLEHDAELLAQLAGVVRADQRRGDGD